MKKIKILPIYPKSPPSFWSFNKSLEIIGKKAVMPPTGLATVMAMFPKNKFKIMQIIDLNVENLDKEKIKKADLIATSSMLIHKKSHEKIVKIAHKYNKKVIAGGPYPTDYPEQNKEVDFLITGEAELTLPPFIEDFLKNKAKKIYSSENIKDKSKTILTKSGRPDLTQTPIPRWDLFNDLNVYDSIGIQFSRGCPFDCEFCNITSLYGREPRTKSPKQMIAELNAIKKTNYQGGIFIVDDNLIGNINNLRKFLPELIKYQKKNNYQYTLMTEASMNLAWPENTQVLKDMAKAGFTNIFLGIESVDKDIINNMNKKQNLRMSPQKAVKIIQNAGLKVMGGFIIGTDGEKSNVFNKLFKFVQETGIVLPMIGLLTIVQGTKLHERLKNENRLNSKNISISNTHTFSLGFKPKLTKPFTEKKLLDGYKKLLEKIFSPKNYYERCRISSKRVKPQKTSKQSLLSGLKILAKFTKQQLFGGYNRETWKYLIETLIKNPKNFTEAVTEAIKFQHLKSITKDSIKAYTYKEKVEIWYKNFKKKSKIIITKYKNNIQKRKKILLKKANNLFNKAHKSYIKIPEDFKTESHINILDNLKQRLDKFKQERQLVSLPSR
ncbi:MAG: B12-binding domain-containing radical SAM protein [Nanoarchaeota archaeon]|nr:B12-binding domain-containing radical SAM protein [Nanoarchaeota archaeon]